MISRFTGAETNRKKYFLNFQGEHLPRLMVLVYIYQGRDHPSFHQDAFVIKQLSHAIVFTLFRAYTRGSLWPVFVFFLITLTPPLFHIENSFEEFCAFSFIF